MDSLFQWGLEIVRQVQTLGPAFKVPMQLFAFLGQEEFFLLLMPLIFWCVNKWVGANLAYVLILSSYFNGLFKGLWQWPRPYWLDASLQQATETSFGLPSGHAQNAVTVWSYLAYRNPFEGKPKATGRWLIALLLIALVSLSRIYLGVHFPFDVLGGWVLGGILLVCYIALQPRLSAWLVTQRLSGQIALAILVSAAALGLYSLSLLLSASGVPAYDTSLFYGGLDEARKSVFTSAGMLLGGGLGLALERRYVRFTVAGSPGKRALRYLVGIAGVVGLWAGLKAVFPAEPMALGLMLRLVRYIIVLLWAVWLWPWLFVRLGWAGHETSAH